MKELEFFYKNINAEEFEKILCDLTFKNDFFFTLYNNAPKKLKPSLEEDSLFVKYLCRRVELFDDNSFNDWFFDKNLKKFYALYEIRNLVDKRPENKALSEFLQEQDKPKSINELLSTLIYNRDKDYNKYLQIIEENELKLKALNTKRFSAKSTIMDDLSRIFVPLNFKEKEILAKELHLNIKKIFCASHKNLNIDITELSIDELKDICATSCAREHLLYKIDKNLFQYHNKNTGYFDKFFDILSVEQQPDRLEKAEFILDTILTHFESNLRLNKKTIKGYFLNLLSLEKSDSLDYFIISIMNKTSSSSGNSEDFKKELKKYEEDIFLLCNPVFKNLQSLKEKPINTKVKI